MKKTKIICTMGPNTNDRNVMMELAKNGMWRVSTFPTAIMRSTRAAWNC